MSVGLPRIVAILHRYGYALDRESITKVLVDFQHTPSDLGDALSDSDWALSVRLLGTGDKMKELFNREWSSLGATEEEALQGVYDSIVAEMRWFYERQLDRSAYLSETMQAFNIFPSEEEGTAEAPPEPVAADLLRDESSFSVSAQGE